MKIIQIGVMRGPNYWSARHHQLIVMKLDLQELEHRPTHQIEGFYENVFQLIPSLVNHRCSESKLGGFLYRVVEGTWMGHVVEHIALEIQALAGMDCGFGQTLSTGEPGVYHVVFDYVEENAGLYAAQAAVQLTEALARGDSMDLLESQLNESLHHLEKIGRKEMLGPSTASLVKEAQRRGIPCTRLDNNSLVMLGNGIYQQRVEATITGRTSSIAVDLACDKEKTKRMLESAAVPVPKGRVIRDLDELRNAIEEIGYPIVLKPVNGNHGRGASINVTEWKEAVPAFHRAQNESPDVMVERFVVGYDFRMLVVNYKLVAAARRTPASVTGDGVSSIRQLIDQVNSDPRRGACHEKVLTAIKVDKETLGILQKRQLTLDSVLEKGECLLLKATANLSTGGTSTDVTDHVHPFNVAMAERIARRIGLDICGIDVMAPDLETPLTQNGGAVLEVNAAPGFRMHLAPSEGKSRNVAAPVIDMLFPAGKPTRIPLVAVTGTNGKTTTTRLMAYIAQVAGHRVGYTTTEGVYLDQMLIQEGDCTGPASAQVVLQDPGVDFAVLECARGGILRSGLGFAQCDVGIVTNVAADHLGLHDIHTLDQMAQLKSVVPQSVYKDGYAVLNADDDVVYAMAKTLRCRVALFAMDPANDRIRQHCEGGGLSAYVSEGYLTIRKGMQEIRVEHVRHVPLTYDGRAGFMVQNALAALLAAYVQQIDLSTIRLALNTFVPSPEQTPGRMNLFKFRQYEVLVDYAHNPAGFEAIGQFLRATEASPKVGLICGTGDRRDEDLIELGRLAGELFDQIVIRHDTDSRGRDPQDMVNLLLMGIYKTDPDKPVRIIPDESQAIHYLIHTAVPNSLITICCDDVLKTVDMVRQHKEEEDKDALEMRMVEV
jgi:cyanophycin synthetase